ncbi:MAG: efflux RND transporter periplasmic adaptor subunit [Acidisphaera sp.]|nr:efflux RND transporter periplasmic adaptor subunit [Acidisphaera sp.]MBV9812806.1 efflux RND transporter periplasmic adaptor subunit [Acetobacteraceae bacterium]
MRPRTALLACVALAVLGGCKERNQFAAPPPPQVVVAHPEQRKVDRYLEATGSTAALNEVDLVARVQGFLQEISYKDGDVVHKGQILFTIEPLPYQLKLQQAQAAVSQQQAVVTQAEQEYNRQASLGRSDFSSQSTVQQALATRDSARAALAQAQANAQQAAIDYSYTRVLAPMDGVATAHLVSVGELVGSGQPTKLASVVQLEPIYVNFSISEAEAQRIRASLAARGQTIRDVGTIPVEIGLQTETGYPHAGTLDYASPTVDPSTGTLAVRARLPNTDTALLPGYFARVRLPLERDVATLLVPDTALGANQAGQYVLVVGAGDVVEERPVQTGPLYGDKRAIEQGLAAGDLVVVAGLQRAAPGEKVAPRTATQTASR